MPVIAIPATWEPRPRSMSRAVHKSGNFGLRKHECVDVEVILPAGGGRLERRNVACDQRLSLAK
ncbi:MAG: hypothetical protein WCL32_21215 [Planctomycetota bacterium]